MVILQYKRCSKCKTQKLLSEFYKFRMGEKTYHRGACKRCWHEQIVSLKKEYQKIPQGFYYSLKSGAKKRGIVFSIPRDKFVKWWNEQKKRCYYCNRTIEDIIIYGDTIDKGAHRLTVDRIDNKKGYDLDNIIICCHRCNFIKSDFFTKEEMIEISKIIKKKIKKERDQLRKTKKDVNGTTRVSSNYATSKDVTEQIFNKPLSEKDKRRIDEAVRKVVSEYGTTLRLLEKD